MMTNEQQLEWLHAWFDKQPNETLMDAMLRRMNEPNAMFRFAMRAAAMADHDPGDEDVVR